MANIKMYQDDAKHLFENVGGYENIISFKHCMTRMRFTLRDWSKVNEQEIKSQKYCTGINKVESSNQYQVIIGMGVADFYKAFCEVNDYESDGVSRKNIDFKTKQKEDIAQIKAKWRVKGWGNKALSFISNVFSPIVYPLLGYGLILTIWSLLTVEWSGPASSAADSVHFFKWVVDILDILVGTFSLFITVVVSYTVFRAMNANGVYGIIIGVILTSKGLVEMGAVDVESGESILGNYPGFDITGNGNYYPWLINFNGLLIPMIVVAIFGVYMERWTDKIKNQTAKQIVAPVLIILVTYLFALFIIAPIGMLFTNYLSISINWLSTNYIAKYIALPIIAALYGPLVITGMHHSITPIILQGQATYGATIIQGFITISNISQGIATIAFTVLHKRVKELKNVGVSNGVSAIVGGITEPSLFTVNLKHLFPLIACSIGTACGTLLLVASNTYALQGASSIFGILMYQMQAPELTGVTTWIGGGYVWGILSILLSCGVTFIMTLILGKTKYFWNRSKDLLQEDYNVDINTLKIEMKVKKPKQQKVVK
ncbi:PTS system, trehalose-specific IIB component [Spiroplasma chinense]|uniref:PTS system, trehalose-specific IIB component n=1 Tax=Spiroplasma chinense TaxID=216932 RepID=A0A5B9Y5L2_9MOLU|nr:PTS transporter subunit EIIC [Spiroplasma chinense]QEH61989.1 PTS system, trehalose-specific IIB component [Spiroplasma chinense]